MRVFVTGASGHIGLPVVRDLRSAGHEVVGLARSDAAAEKIASAGAEVRRGTLDDLDGLREASRSSDGVIQRTRELLGWKPAHAGLLADIAEGHYFASTR